MVRLKVFTTHPRQALMLRCSNNFCTVEDSARRSHVTELCERTGEEAQYHHCVNGLVRAGV